MLFSGTHMGLREHWPLVLTLQTEPVRSVQGQYKNDPGPMIFQWPSNLLGAKNTVLVTFSVFSLKNSPAGALALPFRV